MLSRSSLDNPETIPDIALNPSHKINIQSLELAVPLLLASMKLAIPRTDFVLDPSVFLASLLSLASVKLHATSMTPIFATFSMKPSDTVHVEPNLLEGVFI